MKTETHYESLVSNAIAFLSGNPELLTEVISDFSNQISFLHAVCQNCIIDCHGCINNCPYPKSWPESTVPVDLSSGRFTLEGFALCSGKDEGKVAGYMNLWDDKNNKVYSKACVISLPCTH
jgi:hypothetical protein